MPKWLKEITQDNTGPQNFCKRCRRMESMQSIREMLKNINRREKNYKFY